MNQNNNKTYNRRQDNIWLLHRVKNLYLHNIPQSKDKVVDFMKNDLFINSSFHILFNEYLNETLFIDYNSNEVYSYNCEFYCYYILKK